MYPLLNLFGSNPLFMTLILSFEFDSNARYLEKLETEMILSNLEISFFNSFVISGFPSLNSCPWKIAKDFLKKIFEKIDPHINDDCPDAIKTL